MPIAWYDTKTMSAQAAVVLRFAVGPATPGMRLSRFPVRMNRPSVAISGRYGRPSGPITSSISAWNCSRTTSRKFWAPRGTSSMRRDATKATPTRMIITTHV